MALPSSNRRACRQGRASNKFALSDMRAGLASIPCWIREMDDATACMELVRANAQSELTALERGMHALHSGKSIRDYAEEVGTSATTVTYQRHAADVFTHVNSAADMSERTRQLVEIHAAPRWLWSALVSAMIADSLTVEATRKLVASVKDAPEPPERNNLLT